MNFDVIIIGGGAAGISAALWCDELQLKTLLLEAGAELGGQLLRVYNPIANHLGVQTENGRELRDIFSRQIENRRFEVRLQSEITTVDLENKLVKIKTGEELSAKNIILATGVRRRRLNVPGEEEFQGKGIIESGKRDANLVKDKNVCIIGGGDAAFENALILSETAASVTLIHRQTDFRARREFIEQVKNHPKIEIAVGTIVRKIIGSEKVEAVELEHLKTGEIYQKDIEAIIIRIGVEPNIDFLKGQIELDQHGYIKINQNCETNIKGIYAVGDVANPIAPTVSSSVGMSATAAKTITNYELQITNESKDSSIRNS